MLTKTKYHPVISDLEEMIRKNKWEDLFAEAIKKANSKNVPYLAHVTNLVQYLDWINESLFWVPMENVEGMDVEYHLCAFISLQIRNLFFHCRTRQPRMTNLSL